MEIKQLTNTVIFVNSISLDNKQHINFLKITKNRRNARLVFCMERVKGIEPSPPAWEAGVLPLNHTRTIKLYLQTANV
jgi:hypothetical protein